MKYFTPQLLGRVRSANEAVAAKALVDWDQAITRSQRRWQKIKTAVPKNVRRFEADTVCLHAAQVLSMGRRSELFVLVAETEPPRQELVILTFFLDKEPLIEQADLVDRSTTGFVMWLYEEWDLDRRGNCRFDLLLSNGWVLKLRYRDFQYLVVQRIRPAANGRAARNSSHAVLRSA